MSLTHRVFLILVVVGIACCDTNKFASKSSLAKVRKRKRLTETIMDKYVPAANHPWRNFRYGSQRGASALVTFCAKDSGRQAFFKHSYLVES